MPKKHTTTGGSSKYLEKGNGGAQKKTVKTKNEIDESELRSQSESQSDTGSLTLHAGSLELKKEKRVRKPVVRYPLRDPKLPMIAPAETKTRKRKRSTDSQSDTGPAVASAESQASTVLWKPITINGIASAYNATEVNGLPDAFVVNVLPCQFNAQTNAIETQVLGNFYIETNYNAMMPQSDANTNLNEPISVPTTSESDFDAQVASITRDLAKAALDEAFGDALDVMSELAANPSSLDNRQVDRNDPAYLNILDDLGFFNDEAVLQEHDRAYDNMQLICDDNAGVDSVHGPTDHTYVAVPP